MEIEEEYQYDPFPFLGSKKNQKGNSSPSLTQSLLKFLFIGLFLSYCANFITSAVDKEKKVLQGSDENESLNSRVSDTKVRETGDNKALNEMDIDKYKAEAAFRFDALANQESDSQYYSLGY